MAYTAFMFDHGACNCRTFETSESKASEEDLLNKLMEVLALRSFTEFLNCFACVYPNFIIFLRWIIATKTFTTHNSI